jgi:hypothetical protein
MVSTSNRSGTMRHPLRAGFLLAAALIGAAGCTHSSSAVRMAAAPTVSAIVVRNSSAFDVNVYAVPNDDAPPIWLATVPAKGTWQLPVSARALRADGQLTVRTQAIGASRVWTSPAVAIDDANFGLLDLSVSASGDCSLSALRSVNAAEMTPWM